MFAAIMQGVAISFAVLMLLEMVLQAVTSRRVAVRPFDATKHLLLIALFLCAAGLWR